MKFQNPKTKSKIAIINIVILIVFFTSFVFIYLNVPAFGRSDEFVLFISLLLLIYLAYLGCPFFRYDSEGETLIFQNEKSLPIAFLVRESLSDFPKRKLVKFVIKNKPLFKKVLEIYISSKRVSSGQSKVNFDISYLNSRQIRDIRISLNKVISENKKEIYQ
ncbi:MULTISPECIES: hypothetical protein [Apibacter]|uniref:hypothetical protein n=1 Tax=Apibacter TaxID=1778601 RepID=UPI0013292FCA|nr:MULTISPECIES: hypothetical protein [Apibacter]MXO32131.1 hypothetical protein [Apibacter sp. B2912]MXO33937.1 hypothetical protein [Apibacter sp. B3883]MXO41294.1 hypothetical protein [Apibacter sp. B3889]MXP04551.1 hypothetical protein [Apibacter sp. B3887]MXP06726.1 hypothetical protein [Apibacter sp. B3935]